MAWPRCAVCRSLTVALRGNAFGGLLRGLFSLLAYAVVIRAMTRAPLAAVAAVRECSVIVAAFIGAFLLREPAPVSRFAAAIAVAIGIGLLQWANAI